MLINKEREREREREREKLQKDINDCNYGIKKEYVSSFFFFFFFLRIMYLHFMLGESDK